MPMVEEYVTLSCVSNEVGGPLIGTAKWLGVPLATVLGRAGVQKGADQIVGRSVDSFTVGFPTAAALDGRTALLAVGMNGEPLPVKHGFPARLVIAGLYGYVSATKWVSELEATTFDAYDAYWVPRGWSQRAPIKTESRIDVPRGGTVAAGVVSVAGVAWAPTRGIDAVEVQIDGGSWRRAELATAISKETWRQWLYRWNAEPGTHELRVRATDGDGKLQDGRDTPPPPNGATGYHTIVVRVA
jgi:DMSO/TMAO reductase YedYZ molybdopterin-dependent catalytic subunit